MCRPLFSTLAVGFTFLLLAGCDLAATDQAVPADAAIACPADSPSITINGPTFLNSYGVYSWTASTTARPSNPGWSVVYNDPNDPHMDSWTSGGTFYVDVDASWLTDNSFWVRYSTSNLGSECTEVVIAW